MGRTSAAFASFALAAKAATAFVPSTGTAVREEDYIRCCECPPHTYLIEVVGFHVHESHFAVSVLRL